MTVLMIEPGKAPFQTELTGLAEMQKAVGGLIQAVYPFEEPVALVCNDEGLLLRLPFNRSLPGGVDGIWGPFFLCGLGEENFCSLTPEQLEQYSCLFRQPERLVGICGRKLITARVETEE